MKNYQLVASALLLFSLSVSSVYADDLPDKVIEKGVIVTTYGKEIAFKGLVVYDGQMKYKNVTTSLDENIDISNVLRVKEETGDEAKESAISFGLAGGLGAALGVSTTNTDGVEVKSSTKSAIILGLAAISAAVGYVSGKKLKKYQDVYVNRQYSHNTPGADLMLSGDAVGLKLVYEY